MTPMKLPLRLDKRRHPSLLLFIILIIIVLAVEVLVEAVTSAFLKVRPAFATIVDPLLTVLLSTPIVWWLVVRPLRRAAMESQLVLRVAMDGFWTVDMRGRFLEVNDAYCSMIGYTRDELLAMRISDIEGAESLEATDAHLATIIRAGSDRFVSRHRRKDGAVLDVEVSANYLPLGGGRIVVFVRDITEHKRAMDTLMASEAYLRAIMDNVPHLMWLKDPNGRFLAVNHAFARACGHGTAEEVIGKTDLDFWPTDLASKYRSDDAVVMATRKQKSTEEPIAEPGGIKWFETFKTPILADGEVIGTTGVAQDITERRMAEESRRLQSAALHAAGDAIIITDRAGVIEWVNPAFTGLTGYTAEEALGESPGKLIGSGRHAPAFFKEFWETILAGRTWVGEMINRRKDGSLWTERQSVTPIPDASGAITHFVAIKRDLTKQLQLEAQFRQAQKMEGVGQLASGVAHDFNNLLTVINGMSELVLGQVDEDDPMRADVQEIRRAGERAATLTRQLLAFSRQQILEPRVLKVNTVVAGMEDLLRRLLGEDIELVVVPTPDVGNVKADAGQLEQVLTNLAVNARDAMPHGGRLTIETQNVTVGEDDARQQGENIPPGSYVRLAVSDSGVGMDEATRVRMFEPFFTTKGPGKGTGLGLSTVYGIIKQSQGFIGVYSEVGHGTSVRIYLPRTTGSVDTDRPGPTTVSSSGTETILLVEDNDGLRKLATRLLEHAGYTVLGTATGEEAMRVLERHDAPVQLLLSDVVMPGMSGRLLAERLAQSHPAMKVLYMSGYTSDTVVRHGVLEAHVPFLNKPFTAAALLRKVREVLDSQA